MHRFLVSLATVLVFAGAAHAQTDVVTPKKPAPAVQKAATTQVVHPPAAKPATTPPAARPILVLLTGEW